MTKVIDMMAQQAAPLHRRTLLKGSLVAGAAVLLPSGLAYAGTPTPAQTEGPFHPMQQRRTSTGAIVRVDQRIRKDIDRDADLTFTSDNPGVATGTPVELSVRVMSAAGPGLTDRPLANADVELWQACASGRYNHRSDPSREWLDPNFQYWGKGKSDAQGNVRFKTIVPGAYLAGGSWVRPPHIHVRASAPGHRELTSQWYFEGVRFYYNNRMWSADELRTLNGRDQVLGAVPLELRTDVIARVRRVGTGAAATNHASYTLRLAPR
jgi:protocatechuate 3,4-dioxygenase, beta subunit